jgi:hypothetical protein
MADYDKDMEPYLAFRDGMSLNRIVTKYGIANIRLVLNRIECGLVQLDPHIDRNQFLAKARTALEIRRRDAGVGRERAAAERAASIKPPEDESAQKRGAEWATVDSMQPVRPQIRRKLKVDLPWSGAPAQPYHRSEWTTAREQMGEQQPAEFKLPLTIAIKPSRKDQRKRQLEQCLLIILDEMPHSAHRSELVDVVDLAVAGVSIPKIANKLGISTRTVKRRLDEVTKAAKTEPCH